MHRSHRRTTRERGLPGPTTIPWIRFHREGQLDIKLFQKPLHRYLYLPFRSFHPRKMKISVITSEPCRYVLRNTSRNDWLSVRKLFYVCLRVRGYPALLLRPLFKRITYEMREHLLSKKASQADKDTPHVLVLPWAPTTEWMEIFRHIHDTWPLAHCEITKDWRTPLSCFRRGASILTDIHGSARNRPLTSDLDDAEKLRYYNKF